MGVILLREVGVNGEDYNTYDLFPDVVVHCIDTYAEHRVRKLTS